MFYIFVIVFFVIASIAGALVMVSAIYSDKNHKKSYKLFQTGLLIGVCDCLLLVVVLIILMFV